MGSFAKKSQTNPITLTATGYAPYIEQRGREALKKKGPLTTAEKHAKNVLQFWVNENFNTHLTEYSKNHAKDLFRNQWECAADKKTLRSRVTWEMGKIQAQMDEDLERRRRCLGVLLKTEQDALLQQTCEEPEDEEARTQRMLARYAELKAKKEEERLKIVEEKREQQFRRNCDELRSKMSRKLEYEVAEDARRLQEERMALSEKEKGVEEALLERLWEQDFAAKGHREAQEAAEKRRRDVECARELQGQAALNKIRRIKALKDKAEDGQIMEEKKRLDALEEEWERQQKRIKQEALKSDLDKCLRAKIKMKAQEVQDELTQDLYFLKQIMEKDDTNQDEKKRGLMREQQLYLQYLHERLEREAEFEKQLERMYQEELDRTWEKRQQEWAREKQRRREMEKDVIRGVQEQLAANINKSQIAHAMNKEYAEKIKKEDQEDRKAVLEKLKLIRERNAQHQKELLDQIKAKQDKLEVEQRVRDKELESLREARKQEENKIQQMLSQLSIDNEHPYRCIRKELFNECR